jgi:hypothetical protein
VYGKVAVGGVLLIGRGRGYAFFITRTKEVGELTVRPGVETYKKQLSYRGEFLARGIP